MKYLRPAAFGGTVGKDGKFKVQVTDDETEVSVPGAGSKKFRIYIDGGSIFEDSTAGTGDELVLTLRVLDYCDGSGNKQKIVVLASQPFTPES